MYRYRRRKKLQRRRRATIVTAAIAVLAIAIGVPTLASANGVDNVLNGLGLSGGGGGGTTSGGDTASPSPSPEAGVPPDYVPPLHGTNPHGAGTDAVVDIAPTATNPLDPAAGDEDVIVGDSRGEQNADGTYHGSVNGLTALGITIPDLLTIQTNPGEDKVGATDGLNQALGQLCAATTVCLSLLDMHSATTTTGSSNSFSGANLSIGGPAGIGAPIGVTALNSHGDISHDPATGCQTSHGDSQVLGLGIGSPVAGIGADTIEGTSDSTACPGSQSVTQTSHVLGLQGALAGLSVPITSVGCEDGTPNSSPDLLGLAPILSALGVASIVCNANDQDAGQTSNPYGVREGLTAFVLPLLGGLIKATTAGPESHAVAQAVPVTPVSPAAPPAAANPGNQGNKGNKGGGKKGNGNGNGGGAGAGAAAGAAAAGNGQLAFTGADLLALAMVGGALILGGLALTATAGRRHRRTI
jgi:hypothetical protein